MIVSKNGTQYNNLNDEIIQAHATYVNSPFAKVDRALNYKKIGDDEWKRWTKKLKAIHTKYSGYVQITFMFDKTDLLGYKDSPIDRGPETFMKLFKERIIL